MLPFITLFPEIGVAETRSAIIPPPAAAAGGIPPGEYGFIEVYCIEAGCDCRRVILNVVFRESGRQVATISHAFEPPPPDDSWVPSQTFLDPLNPQSQWSEALLDLFREVVLKADYARRLVRHYRMVKDALNERAHPIHDRIAAAIAPRERPRRPKRK